MAAPEINWTLLRELSTKPHPNLNRVQPPNLPLGVDEVLAEALAVQHLLDTVGMPGRGLRAVGDIPVITCHQDAEEATNG